jgi:hypothetical protein
MVAIVADGSGLTVTVADAVFEHPFAFVMLYVMFAVPGVTPVTTPVALTVATAVFELDHVGFKLVVPKIVVVPTHNAVEPKIAVVVGNGFTVIVVAVDVAEQPLASVTVTV